MPDKFAVYIYYKVVRNLKPIWRGIFFKNLMKGFETKI